MKVASSLTSAAYATSLTQATRSYWKVVAAAGGQQTSGPVWTFATHLPGDTDGDAAVTVADLKLLIATWNTTPASWNWNGAADLDGDLITNLGDLKILVANWNT